MLRQAENKIFIQGILSEVDLKPTSYKRDGKDVEALSGKIIVKVNQKISGKDTECFIPIKMFSPKYTKNGNINPSYNSIEQVMTNFVSIAASDEDTADRVRFNASIEMNEYYPAPDKLVSFPTLRTSFVNKISKEQCDEKAEGEVEFFIAEKTEEIINEEPTGRIIIKGVVPQYGGRVDVVPFHVESTQAIDIANNYWNVGDTVRVNIKPNFTSETKEIIEEVEFGDPVVKTRTTNISEIIVSGGRSREPLDESVAFSLADIQGALAERKARLEAQKEKDASRTKSKAAPAQNLNVDLGF